MVINKMTKVRKPKKNGKFLIFRVKTKQKWQNFKKKVSKTFNKENFEEIIDFFGYVLTFGVPIGLALLGIASGYLFLVGLGVAALIWVFEQKGLKILRGLWFR